MPVVIEGSEVIDRKASVVFRFYAVNHVENHPRWDPDMKLEQVSPGSIRVGTVIRRVNSHSGSPVEGRMTVTEFEIDHSMTVEIQDGPVRTIGRVSLKALGPDRTQLTIQAIFPDSDDPTLKQVLAPMIQRSARNIKKLVESES